MRADIFCRVVDNFGDIGVCWRLARRLAHGRGWQVRLWVDHLPAFARIQPGIAVDRGLQRYAGIDVVHWTTDAPAYPPGDVVIEAFACDPPPEFVRAMQARPPVWINLEYLSAEPWVESCHGVPSRRADGLIKYFFFPGFTGATGGLLREPGLSQMRDRFQASRPAQADFLRGLGLGEADLAAWRRGGRLATLFCYPHAPIAALTRALAHDGQSTLILAPEGVAPGLEQLAGGALQVARVPFVEQPDFDRLLWCADLNLVRGEDSFVRAAWAARPLVWHIYPQQEDAHLQKLEAWLACYPAPAEAQALIRAWNSPGDAEAAVSAAVPAALAPAAWQNWQHAARNWDANQSNRPDLGDTLADFCAELAQNR